MKKAIVVILIIVLLIAGCSFVLFKSKTAITSNEFKSKMEEKGYTVIDYTYQFEEYSFVKKVYAAVDGNMTYQIEFFEFEDENRAMNAFKENKSTFEEAKTGTSSNSEVNGTNHSKYTQNSGGKYSVVSRIANTLLYANVNDADSLAVKSVMEELGY